MLEAEQPGAVAATAEAASPSALVVGDDPVNVLGVARNLGRFRIPVHRLGGSDSPVLRSRYFSSTRVVEGLEHVVRDLAGVE